MLYDIATLQKLYGVKQRYLYVDTPGSTLAGGNDTLWGGSNTFLYGGGGTNDNATCTRIAA